MREKEKGKGKGKREEGRGKGPDPPPHLRAASGAGRMGVIVPSCGNRESGIGKRLLRLKSMPRMPAYAPGAPSATLQSPISNLQSPISRTPPTQSIIPLHAVGPFTGTSVLVKPFVTLNGGSL